ncbi:MAG TPA: hypothetical protein VMR02_00150 [Terracidiphilus sp.]|nr:hypothetical protein [Terracidiphilus sp.]
MTTKFVQGMVLAASMLLVWPSSPELAQAQEAKAPYAAMAPLDQYLIADRDAEIALAKSAAPPALSSEANVLVLEKDGYHTAIEGKNGFTCIVERSWMSPIDSTDFWNPKLRGPICYNPPAVRSILPYTILRTKLILGGLTKDQMVEKIQTELAGSLLPIPEPGAMSYMMSKNQYLGDSAGHWHSHLMFHLPRMGAASWGANLDGSPVVLDTDHTQGPEPEAIFMVPVDHWSDGSSAEDSATHQH